MEKNLLHTDELDEFIEQNLPQLLDQLAAGKHRPAFLQRVGELGPSYALANRLSGTEEQQSLPTDADRFLVHHSVEALTPKEPIRWVVEGLLSADSTVLMVGEGGSKKTYSAMDMGVCVSLGLPWLKFQTEQRRVLFIDEESGPGRFHDRLGDVMRGHLIDEEIPFDYICLAQFDLRSTADLAMLHQLIEQTGAELVFIDALADIMPGGDENAVKDVQPVFRGLRKIASDNHCCIVVIHHTNKNGDYRGSTAMRNAVDLLLYVESKEDSPNIDYHTSKARDGRPQRFAAVVHFEQDQTWLSSSDVTERAVDLPKAQQYVVDFLTTHGDSERQDILDGAGGQVESVRKAIPTLVGAGVITRVDDGQARGRGYKAVFGLTKKEGTPEKEGPING